MQLDIRIMELLSSRMCHDLVSPVGAINNGVELIEEVGGSTAGEAIQLIAKSAQTAARRLRCFRLAYGRAGSESGLAIADVRQVAEQYLEGGKSKLIWPTSAPIASYAEHRGALKLLLNAIMLAEETLAYGGTIEVSGELGTPDAILTITGRGARVPDAFRAALEGELAIDDITSKSVHGYMTASLGGYYDFEISADTINAEPGEEAIRISIQKA